MFQNFLKPCLHHAIFAAGNARRVNRRCGDPHCWCTCVFTWSDVARKWAGRNHVIRGVTWDAGVMSTGRASRPRKVKAMDSDSDDDMLLAAAACLIKTKQRAPRSCWTRPWLLRRNLHGAYHTLLQELQHEDAGNYANFLRMEHRHFEELLSKVEPLIGKQSTVLREAIPAGERLAITLRFLASGMYSWHAYITVF